MHAGGATCALFPILKEHQITTGGQMQLTCDLLFPILKEHQITTHLRLYRPATELFPILKEHQITTRPRSISVAYHCSRFSKSIKSQQGLFALLHLGTVPDSQRASNHNSCRRGAGQKRLFPILKEHQITTLTGTIPAFRELFPILKEHQITTAIIHGITSKTLFPILKEHQITTVKSPTPSKGDCSRFSKSIKSQQWRT